MKMSALGDGPLGPPDTTTGPPVRGWSVENPSRNGPVQGWSVEVGQGGPRVPPHRGEHGPPGTPGTLRRTVHQAPHHCGQHTLIGLDADRCALTARVDPYPITALGEVHALQAGRRTYHLDNGRLYPRDRWTIPGHPPSHQLLVLATHDCTGIPHTWRMPPPPPAPQPQENPW